MVPTTIEDEIRAGSGRQICHRTVNQELTLVYGKNELKMPFNPLISKYKEYFDNHILVKPLTEAQQTLYRYAPKMVSRDIYGTTSYWSVILFINEAHSVMEFEPTDLKYVDPQYIVNLFEEIFILEG